MRDERNCSGTLCNPIPRYRCAQVVVVRVAGQQYWQLYCRTMWCCALRSVSAVFPYSTAMQEQPAGCGLLLFSAYQLLSGV